MARILLLSALLLSSCATLTGGRRSTPFKFGDKGDLVDFSYAWPAEASAIPALEKRFRADLDRVWKEALSQATADRAAGARDKRNFRGHQLSFEWVTAGQSRRLLSLQGKTITFTGGAHPNHGSSALLWDRRAKGVVAPGALTSSPDQLQTLVQREYCPALDKERFKRRGKSTARLTQFVDCPKFEELTFVPADSDGNARFDRLRTIADPYVAGPYSEGTYEIALPVTATFLATIKPVYRSSFEVGQPQ